MAVNISTSERVTSFLCM